MTFRAFFSSIKYMTQIKHLKNPIYLGLIEAFILIAESKREVEVYIHRGY